MIRARIMYMTTLPIADVRANLSKLVDEAGSMAAVKAAGKARLEGKDYVMQDGDVVEFRSGLTSGGKK